MDLLRDAVEEIKNEGDQRVNGLIDRVVWRRDPEKRRQAMHTLHEILSMGECSERQKEIIRQLIIDKKRERR